MLTGAFLLHPAWDDLPKVVVAVVLQLASAAVGSMAIARAGFLAGAAPTHRTVYSQIEFDEPDSPDSGDSGEDEP